MPRTYPRPLRLCAVVGTLAASAFALAGCAPSHAGAAATVGSDRITDNQVKAGAQTMLSDSGTQASASSDVSGTQRSVLSRLIIDDLLADAARAKNITVTEGEVQSARANAVQAQGGEAQLEQAAAQSGVAAADIHDYLYYSLLQQKLGTKLTAGQKVPTVDLKVIQAADKATADKLLTQLQADPSQFSADVTQYSQDTSTSGNGGDIGTIPLAALSQPLQGDVASKSVGDLFEEALSGEYFIFLVNSRGTTPVSQLDSQSAQTFESQAVDTYLASLVKNHPVSVSPRYGTWDPTQLAVVAGTDALTSQAPGSAPSSAPASPVVGG